MSERPIRLVLDTSAVLAYGRGDAVGETLREVQLNEPSGPNGENVLTNASDLRSVDLRVHQLTAKFASIDAFKVGDITFATSKEEGMNVLTVRIPVVAGSKWFGALGVSERSLEQWNRLSDDAQKSNAARRKQESKRTPAFAASTRNCRLSERLLV